MQHIPYRNLNWAETPGTGIAKAEIARHLNGGGVAFWRVPQGGGFPAHAHKGYEYIYLVEGRMTFSGVTLEAGDFLLTAKDEMHEAIALQDSLILVVNETSNR